MGFKGPSGSPEYAVSRLKQSQLEIWGRAQRKAARRHKSELGDNLGV